MNLAQAQRPRLPTRRLPPHRLSSAARGLPPWQLVEATAKTCPSTLKGVLRPRRRDRSRNACGTTPRAQRLLAMASKNRLDGGLLADVVELIARCWANGSVLEMKGGDAPHAPPRPFAPTALLPPPNRRNELPRPGWRMFGNEPSDLGKRLDHARSVREFDC